MEEKWRIFDSQLSQNCLSFFLIISTGSYTYLQEMYEEKSGILQILMTML